MATEMKKKYAGWTGLTDAERKAEKARQDQKRAAAEKNAVGRPTNAFFATHDEEFMEACQNAGVQNTARQASKWRRKRGIAWGARRRVAA